MRVPGRSGATDAIQGLTPRIVTLAWKVPKAPAQQREATPSTIPTLLLAGSFDSVTPTSWARIAARTLPNSTLLQFPGIGHFVTLASRCAQRVFASFLTTPSAPHTACVAKLRPPRFKPAPRG
jgi:pimeloyl-ACP methyl ester carboxylesterase